MNTQHFKLNSTSTRISILKRFVIVLIVAAAAILFTASNAFAEALSYNSLITNSNPVWYMGLNDAQGSTSVLNIGTNTNQGVATDVTFGTQGIIGTSATFNGDTSKITLTDNKVWSTQATVEGWVKASEVNSLLNIFGYRNNAGGGYCRTLNTNANGNVVFYDYFNKGLTVTTNQTLATDEWVYVAATIANTATSGTNKTYTSKIFINGQLAATGSATQSNGALWNAGDLWMIGNKDLNSPSGTLKTFNGSMDELATYNTALSQAIMLSKYMVATNQVSEKSLMANATVTASSNYNTTTFDVSHIKDGQLYDIDVQKGYWLAKNQVDNAYITVDLGDTYNIDKIDLQNCRNAQYGDSGTKDFTLYYSTDGSNWTKILSSTLTSATSLKSSEIMPVESFTFDPVNARYVKFEANSYVHLNTGQDNRAGLSEMWIFEHTNYWGVGTDLAKDWTIDGTNKTGAKFTEANGNTGAYLANHTGAISLNSNAEFEVTGPRVFTQSGSVYGDGGLNKTGDGMLILSNTSYNGDTTVSGGTLLVKSSSFPSQNVTVLSGGTFQSKDVLDNASVNVNGGSLILGTDSSSTGVYVKNFTLSNSGIVNFDMNTYNDHLYGFDFLEVNNSGSLNSGYFNLTFNSNEDLWQEEAQTNGGYELLTYRGSDGFAFSNMGVLVNNGATTDWLLQRVDNDDSSVSIWLVRNDAQDEYYWNADSAEDIALGSWTIDHNPKLGVRFTDGSDTASYGGSISMTEDGVYKVGSGKELTLSGTISGAGAMEKTGSGTLTLSKANTYSGGTTVTEGTLKLSENGTLGSGAVEIQSGSALELAGAKAGLLNVPSLSGSGSISVTSTSFLALASTDPQAYNGVISVDENKSLHIGYNDGADRAADLSLSNATISLASGSNLGLVHENNSAKVSTLTIGTLNGVAGSVVRTSGSNGGADNYSTLTVGQGSFAGVIGGSAGNQTKLNLVKDTDGTLTLSGANTFTGDVDITGGTLVMNYNAKNGGTTDTATAIGNPSIASRRITVHSGATLLTNNGNGGVDIFGGAEAHPAFRIVADGGMIATASDNLTSYGDLELKNGGVFEERGGHSTWFTIFNGDVYVTSGDATIRSTSAGRGISLRGYRNGTNAGVTFDVAKNSTLTLSALLKDSPNSKTVGAFTKTGEGTMILNNGGSTYTGNITINEGTVKVTSGWNGSSASPLGGVTSGKTVTVNSGGELIFNAQDVFINAHSESNYKFVVDGGKISNEGGNYNYLTNTTFRNGGQLYASDGNATWKAFKLHNVKVERNLDDSAGAPVTFSADMSKPNATIVFGAKSDTIKAGTSQSTITVEEITSEDKLINDHVSDLVISAVIADPTYQTSGALKHSTEIIKAGAGTMELTAANTFTGPITVSGGTLLLASSGSLASPNVTVGESAAFQTGANITSTNVTLNGGSFIIGENAASASITAASLTMTDGAIYFDFNGYTASADDYDKLLATSATLTSGIVNLTFNNGDETSWWNNSTDSGYVLLQSSALTADLNSVQLYVGNASTDSWYLTTAGNNLVLMKQDGSEPPEPPTPTLEYYYANTADISAAKWTIDGVNKKGAKFLEGDSAATYANPVELNANGSFEIAADHNLTVTGAISGAGGLNKSGEGTLTLSNNGSSFTGNLVIDDGVVVATAGWNNGNKTSVLGKLQSGRNIIVNEGGELRFASHDVLTNGENASLVPITVNGGRISNAGAFFNNLSNVTLKNGASIYAENGHVNYKAFKLSDNVYVTRNDDDSAASPVLISGNLNNPNAAIAFNANTTRLNVADVTRAAGAATDDLPDLIISTPITDAYNMNKYEAASVEKLGEGTATFSGANTYTGLTYVSAGTLNITGSSFKSRLVVRNGGTAVIDAGDGTVTMNADGYGSSLMIGNGTNGTLIIDSGNVTVRNSGNNTGSVQLGTNAACVGVLTINDGSMQVDGRILFAANNANANAALNMNGGTLTLGVPGAYSPGGDPGCGVLWFGGGTSTVNLNGGTIAMYAMRNNSPKNGSTFNFNGGTIQAVADNDTSFFTQAGNMKFYVKPGGAIFDTNGHNVTVSAKIEQGIDEGDAAGGFTKKGEGKLTMTQAPAYTGSTTVEQGTLALTAGGTLYNLSGGSVNDDGSVAVAAAIDASGQALTIDNAVMTKFVGSIKAQSILKTGYGTLKIYADEENKVVADTFTVSDSELDLKGYYEGDLEVINGAFFSPGNSVGEANIAGNIAFITDTADSNGFAYFEFDNFTGADENHDVLVLGTGNLFTATDGVVLLDFANDDAADWASADVDYLLVANGAFEDGKDYTSWLSPTLTDMFGLEGRTDGLYLIGLGAGPGPEPGSGVPEPSTWALLILGVAGLMYWRKRKN